MSVNTLPAKPSTDAPSGPRTIWLLVHVPKCAGTTVEEHLRKHLPPDQVLKPSRRKAPARYLSRPYWTMPESRDLTKARVVIGHPFGRSIIRHFPDCEIRECVMIRDPLGFLLSHYNYRMSRYARQGVNQIGFELWYRTRPLNPVTHFILNRYLEMPHTKLWQLKPRDRIRVLDDALEKFAFVSSYRSCDGFLRTLSEELGIETEFKARNVTPTKVVTEETIAASLKQQILEENAVDALFFEKYRDRGWVRGAPAAVPCVPQDDRLRAIRRDLSRPLNVVRARLLRDFGAKGSV
ncbi:MAG: hypothetical protein FJ252_01450 [Phycisphaerae bacterium]|nr:hypothetical protein [Phycisphaerae bacterium]